MTGIRLFAHPNCQTRISNGLTNKRVVTMWNAIAGAREHCMKRETSDNVTELLSQVQRGEHGAEAKLVALVYNELHRLAVGYMRRERKEHTLQPTALVHEAYLRLTNHRPRPWKNRAHFFAVAALLMRQILVDHARRRKALVRGGGKPHLNIDDPGITLPGRFMTDAERFENLIALDEALTTLENTHPRQSQIAAMRIFGGMSSKEIGEALGISERTVEREWAEAHSCLSARMRPLA
jgi:RNA polymerase sigma-70 factor, ECF subfamily